MDLNASSGFYRYLLRMDPGTSMNNQLNTSSWEPQECSDKKGIGERNVDVESPPNLCGVLAYITCGYSEGPEVKL